MESRKAKMILNKGGSGSITPRVAIPKPWTDKMGVTESERELMIEFDGERITVRKMNDTDRLIDKIDTVIEKEMMRSGKSGTENVRVSLLLTDDERKLFSDVDKYDNDHYAWDFDGNELFITYTEEV